MASFAASWTELGGASYSPPPLLRGVYSPGATGPSRAISASDRGWACARLLSAGQPATPTIFRAAENKMFEFSMSFFAFCISSCLAFST